MNLLYKLTVDGDAASTFHSRCNSKGATLTLIRTSKGYRSGGYTTISWSSRGNYANDPNAFLFSLDLKEQYFTSEGTNAVYDNGSYGPTFGNGHDLYIANNCSQNYSSYCNFPYAYSGFKARVLSGGFYTFKVNETSEYSENNNNNLNNLNINDYMEDLEERPTYKERKLMQKQNRENESNISSSKNSIQDNSEIIVEEKYYDNQRPEDINNENENENDNDNDKSNKRYHRRYRSKKVKSNVNENPDSGNVSHKSYTKYRKKHTNF
jgi:hypothetical protein